MFKKAWRGAVQLVRLHEPGAALIDLAAAPPAPGAGPLPLRALWDVAAALQVPQPGPAHKGGEAAEQSAWQALQDTQVRLRPAPSLYL